MTARFPEAGSAARAYYCAFALGILLCLPVVIAPPAHGAAVGMALESSSACPVTVVRGPPPSSAHTAFNYGNSIIAVALPRDGHLVAGRLPNGARRATINRDGPITAKFGWWRAGTATLRISGRRLNRPAGGLTADVPGGYSSGRKQPSFIFPR